MIPVTKPFLPPLEEYSKYLEGIWKRQWLTNMGPLASELEMKLKGHLGIKHLLFLTNGTVALQMAIKALLKKSFVELEETHASRDPLRSSSERLRVQSPGGAWPGKNTVERPPQGGYYDPNAKLNASPDAPPVKYGNSKMDQVDN